MIRALIFDCFGVLYRDNLSMIYEVVPLDKHGQVRDIIHATDHGLISRQEYFEMIAALADKKPDDIRAIEMKQFVRNEQLIGRLPELKKTHRIGLLSNIGDETMDRLFPEPERTQLFDAFVLSGQIGLIKPSAQIFNITAERLDVHAEECVMIDDLPDNVEGARAVGMKAILFTSNRQLETDLQVLLDDGRA